jgi:predicted nucleotidyltransferase
VGRLRALPSRAMTALNEAERDCVRRYRAMLEKRLGDRLVTVRLFGSAVRGDMWPPSSPMHSDIDLLVVTRGEIPKAEREELLGATYPLYLECGRQLSPQFFSERRLADPGEARTTAFLDRVQAEGVEVTLAC